MKSIYMAVAVNQWGAESPMSQHSKLYATQCGTSSHDTGTQHDRKRLSICIYINTYMNARRQTKHIAQMTRNTAQDNNHQLKTFSFWQHKLNTKIA